MRAKMLLLGTALSLSLAGTASAATDRDGWYLGLEAGWVHVNDTDLQATIYDDIQFENRWGSMATVGYAYDGHWRAELELGYRNNDVHQVTLGGEGLTFVKGDLTEWTAFVNGIYDQPIAERWDIAFGLGVGVDHPRYSDIVLSGVTPFHTETSDVVFAAQGILGLTWHVSQRWDVALNYRYLWADSPEFTVALGNINTDEMEMVKHTVSIGARWYLDGPAAPPPPPPPPPPPQRIQMPGLECRDGFSTHPRVTQDQEDGHIPRPSPFPGRFDERIHQAWTRHLLRRFDRMRWTIHPADRISHEPFPLDQPATKAGERGLPNSHRAQGQIS